MLESDAVPHRTGRMLAVKGLHFRYPRASRNDGWTLEQVDLSLAESSTLGIVGESGSGKSTLVRILCGLLTSYDGEVEFEGRDLRTWLARDAEEFRRRTQIVFQNPRRSLDPRMKVRRSLQEPIRAIEKRIPSDDEMIPWLSRVGLDAGILDRFPHQLSGGQLQRIAIARAISVDPDVLYADEPTSALDVSVQAQILNLLMDLREQLGLSVVMVSHDLAVVSRLCEKVIVMKDGRIVESGETAELLSYPTDPYTRALVAAARAVRLVSTSQPANDGLD